jgi:hypothetical protein
VRATHLQGARACPLLLPPCATQVATRQRLGAALSRRGVCRVHRGMLGLNRGRGCVAADGSCVCHCIEQSQNAGNDVSGGVDVGVGATGYPACCQWQLAPQQSLSVPVTKLLRAGALSCTTLCGSSGSRPLPRGSMCVGPAYLPACCYS